LRKRRGGGGREDPEKVNVECFIIIHRKKMPRMSDEDAREINPCNWNRTSCFGYDVFCIL
jgi:hypothetical protein